MKAKVPDIAAPSLLTPVDFDPFAESPGPSRFPLTEAQREIWAAAQLGKEASCAYNQCFPLRLRGPFSSEVMQRALQQLAARHEALRLICDAEGEMQTLVPTIALEVPVLDIAHLPIAEQEQTVAKIFCRETESSFDLFRGPLVRAQIIKEAEDCHLVVVTAHHLVCDGWSAGVLLRDLAVQYEAEYFGLPAQQPPAGRFRDYAQRQQEPAYRLLATTAKEYWSKQFADTVPLLDLPWDRPRPPVKTYRCAQQRHQLDSFLSQKLKQAAAKQGVTFYAFLFAACQVLVHRLSGQTDFVIGFPVAGQALVDEKSLVGHGTNLLPLRTQIDPGVSFVDYLHQVKSRLLDAQEHQAVTFGSLVQSLNLPRDPSRTPLVSLIFNVDKAEIQFPFQSVSGELLSSPKHFATFDVEFNLVDTGRELIVECNHNLDLLDPQTVSRWLTHYQAVLESLTKNPDQPVGKIPLLQAEEETRLLQQWRANLRTYPKKECIQELFEEQVAHHPEAIAVSCEGRSLTYRELNRCANRLAQRLQAQGVKPDVLVGLYVDRSVEMIVGILGILKAGGAYLPLDPAYPSERVAFMLTDAEAALLLTQPSLQPQLPTTSIPSLALSPEDIQVFAQDTRADTNPIPTTTPDHLAYVIYTSGSTGTPKGVLVSHYNVVRLLRATEEWFRFEDTDVWTLFHSYAFDFSVWELWGALCYGGRLVVVPYWISRSPEAFCQLLRHEQVTVLNQTPSAFRQLIPEMSATMSPEEMTLRYVIFGGEALILSSLQSWIERYGDMHPQLINMYGITETTVHVTYRPISRADVHAHTEAKSMIGKPIADLYTYVLDRHLRPVPIGIPGELYVGGAGVARGYLRRPELTEARFLSDPFSSASGAQLYKSGDVVRQLSNGDLEYVGRSDQQIKIRGFRIELGEVEALLRQHPSVQDVVAVLRNDTPSDPRLVAYYVAAPKTHVTNNELRQFLRDKAPDYMIPTAFMSLPTFPLTSNGKLDRKALPPPGFLRSEPMAEGIAPRTSTEKTLADVWQAVLGVPEIGVHENFFALGGHSILAARLMTQLRTTFALDLPLHNLFKAPTIAELAAMIEALLWEKRESQGAINTMDRVELDL